MICTLIEPRKESAVSRTEVFSCLDDLEGTALNVNPHTRAHGVAAEAAFSWKPPFAIVLVQSLDALDSLIV